MNLANQPAPPSEQRRVMLKAYTALTEMQQGRGTEEEWRDLADACNLVEALIELNKMDSALMPTLTTAQAHMGTAMRNYRTTGRMTIQVAGIAALQSICGEYDKAIARLARYTLKLAHAHVVARITLAKAGNLEVVE